MAHVEFRVQSGFVDPEMETGLIQELIGIWLLRNLD